MKERVTLRSVCDSVTTMECVQTEVYNNQPILVPRGSLLLVLLCRRLKICADKYVDTLVFNSLMPVIILISGIIIGNLIIRQWKIVLT